MFEKWKQKRQKRKEWIKEKVDQAMEESVEVKKQRIKSSENIAKELLNKEKNFICPMLSQEDESSALELVRDPDLPYNEAFGWPAGTMRGILTLVLTVGFLLITMIIIGIIELPLHMVFEMWKILAGVFGIVVASYFYSRMKMNGGLFK